MLRSKRFMQITPEQGQLLPAFTSDLLNEGHLARVVNEIVDSPDLEKLYCKYSTEGGSAYHPKPLLKVLFYAYADGVRSSRRIHQACQENVAYFYLSGNYKPDHRTISDFRKNNIDALSDLFKQIVKICYELKMVSIGRIFIDGTKVKAVASNSNVICRDQLAEELKKIEAEINQMFVEAETIDKQEDEIFGPNRSGEELPDALQNSRQRKEKIKELIAKLDEQGTDKLNLVEPEARFMKNHGRHDLCYNAQAATENQVVIVCNLNNAPNDLDQAPAIIAELETLARELRNTGEAPLAGVVAGLDAGYDSGKTLQRLEQAQMDGYVAHHLVHIRTKEQQGEIAPRLFAKDKFQYNAAEDCYKCPVGEKLLPVEKRTEKKKSYERHDVIYKTAACLNCVSQRECTNSKSGCRQVSRYLEYDPLRTEMDKKMNTAQGKVIMRQRFKDIEPTFGQLKQAILRHNPFLLRGTKKAKGEFTLCCTAHNIKKIRNYLLSDENDYDIKYLANIQLMTTA